MQVDPPLKCPHCNADMVIVVTGKPTIYVAVCPQRVVTEHPTYIHTPTVEIR